MTSENTTKPLYLLFDFDGTIADSFLLGLSIVNELSARYGFPAFTQETLNEWRGLPALTILKNLHIPFYKLPLFIHDIKKSMHAKLSELRPIEGIQAVLHDFKARNIPMALLTSNSQDNVIPFLDKYDINVFDWLDCDVGLFTKALHIRKQVHKRDLAAFNCIYIGDETRDISAARESSIPVISVCWGLHPKSLLAKHHPDYLIDTPDELKNTIISL